MKQNVRSVASCACTVPPTPPPKDCLPIDVSLSVTDMTDKFTFSIDSCVLDTSFEFKWPETILPYYDGSYLVDPTFDDQFLPTADKSMKENVHVLPIQVSYEENSAGGYTVTIGKV